MLAAVTRLRGGDIGNFIVHFSAHGIYKYDLAGFLAIKLSRIRKVKGKLFRFCLETEYDGESVVQRRLDYSDLGRRIKANVAAVLRYGKKVNVEDSAVGYYGQVGLVFRPLERFKEGTPTCQLKMIFKTNLFQLFVERDTLTDSLCVNEE